MFALYSNNNLYLETFAGLYCLSTKLLISRAEGPVAKKIMIMKNLIRKILLIE
ncbi:hypothetical protein [Spiroplasma endosymbiont of Polydrusus formosus]|uniref:hypothetical protein n=1 Tax=Spiroplasma endosymbiont of Polydrusus formosus TaxID=3139326 RepID=UPI0035B5446A